MRNQGPDLPCFSYNGVFPKMEDCTVSGYSESHQGGVPLVIYDSSDPELPMTVFSPLNQPMAHQMASGFTHGIIESRAFFGAGIKVLSEDDTFYKKDLTRNITFAYFCIRLQCKTFLQAGIRCFSYQLAKG